MSLHMQERGFQRKRREEKRREEEDSRTDRCLGAKLARVPLHALLATVNYYHWYSNILRIWQGTDMLSCCLAWLFAPYPTLPYQTCIGPELTLKIKVKLNKFKNKKVT